MAFVLADRVSETTATAGTGALALAGAAPGFRAFSSVMASGDTTRYTVVDEATGAWETGLGTFTAGTPPTLARSPAASSAGGAAVSLAGNAATRVFLSPDAAHFATLAPRNNPAITGGTIDGATIGANAPGDGYFGFLAVGTNAATGFVNINYNGAAGSSRYFQFQTAGVNRFTCGVDNSAESGSNAGATFFVNRFSDAGGFLSTPLSIARATGAVLIPNADLEGGTIDNTAIGNTTPAAGRFTTLALTGSQTSKFVLIAPNAANGAPTWRQILATDISGLGTLATANAATPPALGTTTPAGGAFTTLSATSTVSGAGFTAWLAAPPAIGGTTPAAGTFTTLTHTGLLLRSMATGLTASTTNTQTGALALTASVNNIGTAAANSAVRLPLATLVANTAAEVVVRNGGANAVNVFPGTGAAINALAANAAFSLASGASARFYQLSATLYVTA